MSRAASVLLERIRRNALLDMKRDDKLFEVFDDCDKASRRLLKGNFISLPDDSVFKRSENIDSISDESDPYECVWEIHCNYLRSNVNDDVLTYLKAAPWSDDELFDKFMISFHKDGLLRQYVDENLKITIGDYGGHVEIECTNGDRTTTVKMHTFMRPDHYAAQPLHVRAENIAQWCKSPIVGVDERDRTLALDIISTGFLDEMPRVLIGNGVPYYLRHNEPSHTFEITRTSAVAWYGSPGKVDEVNVWDNQPTIAHKQRKFDRGSGDEVLTIDHDNNVQRFYQKKEKTIHHVKKEGSTVHVTRMKGTQIDKVEIGRGNVIRHHYISDMLRYTCGRSLTNDMHEIIMRFNVNGKRDGWCMGENRDVPDAKGRTVYSRYENGVLCEEYFDGDGRSSISRTYAADGSVETTTEHVNHDKRPDIKYHVDWSCSSEIRGWLYHKACFCVYVMCAYETCTHKNARTHATSRLYNTSPSSKTSMSYSSPLRISTR